MRLKRNYWLHLRVRDRRRAESCLKSSHRDEAESVVHETFPHCDGICLLLSFFILPHKYFLLVFEYVYLFMLHGGANVGSVVFFFTILRQSP